MPLAPAPLCCPPPSPIIPLPLSYTPAGGLTTASSGTAVGAALFNHPVGAPVAPVAPGAWLDPGVPLGAGDEDEGGAAEEEEILPVKRRGWEAETGVGMGGVARRAVRHERDGYMGQHTQQEQQASRRAQQGVPMATFGCSLALLSPAFSRNFLLTLRED